MRLEKHHLPIPAALLAGCAAAFVTVLIPIDVIENFTASSGLSEMIPQTAPPLGATARMGIAFVAAIVVAGIVLALLGNGGNQDRPARRRGTKEPKDMAEPTPLRMPRFGGVSRSVAVSNEQRTEHAETPESWFARIKRKLDALAGRDVGADGIAVSGGNGSRARGIRNFDDLPKWRSADRHPDHPPRPPIMASADLGDPEDRFPAAEPVPPVRPVGADDSVEGDASFEADDRVDDVTVRGADDAVDTARPVPVPVPVPVAPRAAEPANWRPLGAATTPVRPAHDMAAEDLREDDIDDGDGDGEQVDTAPNDDTPYADARMAEADEFHADQRPYAELDVDDLIDRLERRLGSGAPPPVQENEREEAEPTIQEEAHAEDLAVAVPGGSDAKDGGADDFRQDVSEQEDTGQDVPNQGDTGPGDLELDIPVYELSDANREPVPMAPRLVTTAGWDVPPVDDANDEMDEALRAALETLERMNQRRA